MNTTEFAATMPTDQGSTERMYQQAEHVNTFQTEATIMGVETIGDASTIILDRTIFHPKGGGQPTDRGTISVNEAMIDGRPFEMVISDVRNIVDCVDNGRIYHFVGYPNRIGQIIKTPTRDVELPGQRVTVKIDPARRIMNRRYHSAGHIIDQVVREITGDQLRAVVGNHTPGEAFVEFYGRFGAGDVQRFAAQISEEVAKVVSQNIEPIITSTEIHFNRNGTKMRKVGIGEKEPIFCGGTHVPNTAEIGHIEIGHIRNRNRKVFDDSGERETPTTRISYKLS